MFSAIFCILEVACPNVIFILSNVLYFCDFFFRLKNFQFVNNIDNLTICQLSIDINKFPILMSRLTYETCGLRMRTCGVSYMRHEVVKGLTRLKGFARCKPSQIEMRDARPSWAERGFFYTLCGAKPNQIIINFSDFNIFLIYVIVIFNLDC